MKDRSHSRQHLRGSCMPSDRMHSDIKCVQRRITLQRTICLSAGPCHKGEGSSEHGRHVLGADSVGKRHAQQGHGHRLGWRNALPLRTHWPNLPRLRFAGKPCTRLRILARECQHACSVLRSVERLSPLVPALQEVWYQITAAVISGI